LRLAYIETVKRALLVDQTIEPTQVAAFNQFFDDQPGTRAKRYGIGIDARFASTVYGGVEASNRDLVVPLTFLAASAIELLAPLFFKYFIAVNIGYRLPKRWGIVTLGATNLLDEEFKFQDDSFRTLTAAGVGAAFNIAIPGLRSNANFLPDRMLFATITLSF